MVAAMAAYWRDHPPVHLMVAAYLGVKSNSGVAIGNGDPGEIASIVPTERMTEDEFDAFLRAEGIPLQ